MKRISRSTLIPILIWSTVMSLLLFIGDWLFETVFIFGSVLQIFWFVMGVGVLAVSVIQSGWRGGLAALVAGALVVAASPFISTAGSWSWAWASLQSHKAVYDQVVAQAAALPDQGQIDGRQYRIERGPPVRIAFPQPVGVADNWGAVIHDPSDAVATARGWTGKPPKHTVRSDLQELWGGDLLSCRRITGHYYRCWFT
ncbi:hypothetical protein [Brevundimonas sp.]|uniref:hypothetical protein n=1 Tax=Brevundimonas sp. TaxID=1871086 RepID=UPI002FD8B211